MKIKQITASLLATILLVSTPIASFAGNTSGLGENASGNTQAGIKTGSGGDFSANLENNGAGPTSGKIGIRLSLVDAKDPTKIISVGDDGVTPRVVDILYVEKNTFDYQTQGTLHTASGRSGKYHSILQDEYTFNSIKTQSLTSEADKEGQIYRVFYSQANKMYEKPMVPWLIHNGAYVSQGKEFVDWCKSNDAGQKMLGNGDIFTITIYGIKIPVPKAEVIGYEPALSNLPYVTQGKTEIEKEASYETAELIYKLFTLEALEKRRKQQYPTQNVIIDGDDYVQRSVDELYPQVYDLKITIAQGKEEREERGEEAEYLNKLDSYVDNALANIETVYGGEVADGIRAKAEEESNKHANTSDTQAKQMGENGETGSAGAASIEFDSTEAAHIVRLLNMKDEATQRYYLQTKSVYNHENSEKTGKPIENLKDANEDWVLLVEPIVWLTIFAKNNDKVGIHSKLYGTITNIAQAFNAQTLAGKPNVLYNYRNKDTFNYAAMNAPVWWALSVEDSGFVFNEKDKNDTNSLAFYGMTKPFRQRTYEDLYNSLTPTMGHTFTVQKDGDEGETQEEHPAIEGWGVNVYWKDMLTSQYVPTWTDGGDDDENGGPIKVVKWYVHENVDKNGNVVSQANDKITVTSIANKFAIVNESLIDGKMMYHVENWATGKNASALPSESDLSSTYEEYAGKAPGNFSGNGPAAVDLTNRPDDKVVYIKLVLRDIIDGDPEPITVIKVKEPSDGSTPIIEKGTTSPGTYPAAETGWEYKQDIQTPDPEKSVSRWSDVILHSQTLP